MTLHGFVVLPETLELVATPLKMSVSALVGYIQSETIPLLSILLPDNGLIWNRYFMRTPLETQRSLDARLNMLLLSPVAHGLAENCRSLRLQFGQSALRRDHRVYTGFHKAPPPPAPVVGRPGRNHVVSQAQIRQRRQRFLKRCPGIPNLFTPLRIEIKSALN